MRTLVAILLISVAGCSVPGYSLRSSSATPLVAVNDLPSGVESSPTAPRTIVLVPSVRRGHSALWKTGAIITVASLGVTLFGAVLTIGGLPHVNLESGQGEESGGNVAMEMVGLVASAAGDGGLFIAGPITWMAGIGGPRD